MDLPLNFSDNTIGWQAYFVLVTMHGVENEREDWQEACIPKSRSTQSCNVTSAEHKNKKDIGQLGEWYRIDGFFPNLMGMSSLPLCLALRIAQDSPKLARFRSL